MPTLINNISDLKQYLGIGSRFSIVFRFPQGDECTTQCCYLGMKENKFLIFDLSPRTMEQLVIHKADISHYPEGVQVIVRGFADTEFGHILAFKTKILGIKSLFSWLMFLKLPKSVEAKAVRKDKRFKINVATTVHFHERSEQAVIRDISASGCCLYLENTIKLQYGSKTQIDLNFAELSETHKTGTIANYHRNGTGLSIGINFDRPLPMSNQLRLELLEYSPLPV